MSDSTLPCFPRVQARDPQNLDVVRWQFPSSEYVAAPLAMPEGDAEREAGKIASMRPV